MYKAIKTSALKYAIFSKSSALVFFLGMEFPLAENRLEEGRYWSRYYLGRKVTSDQPVTLHATVIGSAASPEFSSIQQAFFTYIDSIALPNRFRLQYNSWYDHMLDIDEDKIMASFAAIRAGFSDYGVPLDTYVVDDGWANYESFWIEYRKKKLKKLGRYLKERML